MTTLRVDWCSYEAAKYAVMNWHYSRAMPCGKMVRVGVWEDGSFVGCVLFSRGASPPLFKWANNVLGCSVDQICELTRIACTNHKTPISRIGSIAMKFLTKHCPGLRAVVSYADAGEGHHGGIYQAMNWTYLGCGESCKFWVLNGKKTHPRTISSHVKNMREKWPSISVDDAVRRLDAKAYQVEIPGKHKYIWFIDNSLRGMLQPVRYPKRDNCAVSANGGTSDNQSEGAGSIPSTAL